MKRRSQRLRIRKETLKALDLNTTHVAGADGTSTIDIIISAIASCYSNNVIACQSRNGGCIL